MVGLETSNPLVPSDPCSSSFPRLFHTIMPALVTPALLWGSESSSLLAYLIVCKARIQRDKESFESRGIRQIHEKIQSFFCLIGKTEQHLEEMEDLPHQHIAGSTITFPSPGTLQPWKETPPCL